MSISWKRIRVMLALATSFAVLLGAAMGLTACHRNDGTSAPGSAPTKTLYTCGMHPQVIQDKPGNCPICGMRLVPIRKQAGASATAAASGERRILYYKSSMMPGETSPQPAKDSMGMDMVPVYESGAPGPAEPGLV